jgi:hypothetical protein
VKLHGLLLAAALVACAHAEAQETPDAFGLQIEIGRYNVMLHQTEELTAESPAGAEPGLDEPRTLARTLRHVVWRYNLDRSRLCMRGLHTDVACGPAFMPAWLSEPDASAPSLQELQARSNVVGGEVMRFWGAVCDAAREREANEQERMYVCAIE